GRGPRRFLGERRAHGEPALARGLRQLGHRDNDALACRDGREIERARGDLDALGLEGPARRHALERHEIASALYADPALCRREAQRFEDLLRLDEAGRRGAVGEEETIGDEVAVVDLLAEVAAVAIDRAALGVGRGDRLIDPLPDEAAREARIAVEELLVLRQP